ncbi:hypothetical protein U91I_00939 [alpha proteobacterium U9-1i]|nr:hypothetical protein U91I_00939 [alpha proteobacterium U9-1i]
MLAAILFSLAVPTASCDKPTALQELRAMHAAVIARHLDDDVDAWMATEAETMIVGSRGVLAESGPERATGRRAYLGATEFEVYRDMVEPIVRVSDDCTLGWVMVQVEAQGARRDERGVATPFGFQSSWVELYERHDGAWRAVGNVSNFAER